MKPHLHRPALYSRQGADLNLSGRDLADLMRAVLGRGVPFRFRALGASMSPFIQDGDLITVTPLHTRKPTLGEVIAFVHPGFGGVIVHRVIGSLDSACLVRGDKTSGCGDGVVPLDNIVGRVTKVERNARIVRLSLGWERYLVALLSRIRLLFPTLSRLRRMKSILLKVAS